MNGPLVSGGDVVLTSLGLPAFAISADSLGVLYAADEDVNDEVELYVSSLTGPPGPPTGVVATPGNAQATVTFSPPASDGGSPITGYTVTSNPPGGVDSQAGTTALSHVVTNLVNGIAYTFTVTASNDFGTSAPSAPSFPVTPATLPGAPTGVFAMPWNQSATVTFAAPFSNGGSPITGYTVTPTPATAGWIDTNAGSTALTHLMANLINGTAYSFTVRATNAVGTGSPSVPSAPVVPYCDLFCDGFESGGTSDWITQPLGLSSPS